MATHSSIIVWRILGQRSLAGYIVHRVAKRWTRLKRLSTHERSLTDFVILA